MEKTSGMNNEPMLNKQIISTNRSEEKVIQHSKSYHLFDFEGEWETQSYVVEKNPKKKINVL